MQQQVVAAATTERYDFKALLYGLRTKTSEARDKRVVALRELSEHRSRDPFDSTLSEAREEQFRMLTREEQLLRSIEECLSRLEAGTYFTCRDCGDPIEEKRLIAKPFTKICIDCKRKESNEPPPRSH